MSIYLTKVSTLNPLLSRETVPLQNDKFPKLLLRTRINVTKL